MQIWLSNFGSSVSFSFFNLLCSPFAQVQLLQVHEIEISSHFFLFAHNVSLLSLLWRLQLRFNSYSTEYHCKLKWNLSIKKVNIKWHYFNHWLGGCNQGNTLGMILSLRLHLSYIISIIANRSSNLPINLVFQNVKILVNSSYVIVCPFTRTKRLLSSLKILSKILSSLWENLDLTHNTLIGLGFEF